jgi:hypothetical protein
MDLAAAEQIQRKISSISDEVFQAELKILQENFANEVFSTIQDHFARVDLINQTEGRTIITLRRRIHAEFELMKARHLDELVVSETECAALRLKESQRVIPEYEELIAQSKAAASIGDFETAKQFQSLATIAAQKELEKRLTKVDFDVRGQTDTLLQTQQKEIEVLARKLNDGIKQIRDQTTKNMDAECDIRDVKLLGVLNAAAKKLVAIAPPNVDAMVYHRELENDLIALVVGQGLPIPKKMRVNPKTATRGSVKTPRKGQK